MPSKAQSAPHHESSVAGLPFQSSYLRPFLGWQAHWSAGFWQPEQTPFLISRPHFLHGVQPHVWHMMISFHS
jgi:hypothetical protein